MFQAVIVFGLCDRGFCAFPLDLGSLLASSHFGAADMVSVVIRVSLVQLGTPMTKRVAGWAR